MHWLSSPARPAAYYNYCEEKVLLRLSRSWNVRIIRISGLLEIENIVQHPMLIWCYWSSPFQCRQPCEEVRPGPVIGSDLQIRINIAPAQSRGLRMGPAWIHYPIYHEIVWHRYCRGRILCQDSNNERSITSQCQCSYCQLNFDDSA